VAVRPGPPPRAVALERLAPVHARPAVLAPHALHDGDRGVVVPGGVIGAARRAVRRSPGLAQLALPPRRAPAAEIADEVLASAAVPARVPFAVVNVC
jgi:hypothetical protein